MNFELSDEHRMIQEMTRRFAAEVVAPEAARIDREGAFPAEIIAQMAELGLMGIPIPEEYGGAGMDYRAYALAVEEISRACASTGAIQSIHTSVVADPINRHGTEDQKRRYLTKLASGEWIGCYALTEAWAGSDASAIRTTATDAGDHWVVNGTKLFVTNCSQARLCLAFATTDLSGGHRAINAYLVEMDTPGVSIGQHETKMGIRGTSTLEIVFEDVKVPKENLLGEEGGGFAIAMKALDGGRIGIAAQAVGIGAAALEQARLYARERHQFGRPLTSFQATQWKIADMATEIDTARLLTWRAAWLKDAGRPHSRESAMAKLYAAESAMRATDAALQIHGGYGYSKEYAVERHYRDAKICEIYEGTSEIQRVVIARDLIRENG